MCSSSETWSICQPDKHLANYIQDAQRYTDLNLNCQHSCPILIENRFNKFYENFQTQHTKLESV